MSNGWWLHRYFAGPYDEYVEAKAAAALSSSRQAAALDKQKKHMEASIQAAEKQARQVWRQWRTSGDQISSTYCAATSAANLSLDTACLSGLEGSVPC